MSALAQEIRSAALRVTEQYERCLRVQQRETEVLLAVLRTLDQAESRVDVRAACEELRQKLMATVGRNRRERVEVSLTRRSIEDRLR